jgi:transporter family protein
MPAWFAWSLLALVSWGAWAIIGRVIGEALSPAQQQAVSTLGMLPIIAILPLIGKKESGRNSRRGTAMALAAGVLGCLGQVSYYHALGRGEKATTVVSLTAMYPLVTIILGVLFLSERLNRVQLCGIVFSLAAIYLFNVSSASGVFTPWIVLALLPIALWGMTGFLQKLSTNDISGERSTLWFLVVFIPAAVIILIIQPLPASLSAKLWLWAIVMGFFFALGNLAILLAFARDGKAAVITPISGLYPIVSIPLAVLALGEKISVLQAVGIFLALASVVALSWQAGPTQPQAINNLQHEIHH